MIIYICLEIQECVCVCVCVCVHARAIEKYCSWGFSLFLWLHDKSRLDLGKARGGFGRSSLLPFQSSWKRCLGIRVFKKWKKISEKLNFKLNFGFRLEENLYALRDQNIFPYQILCKWSKALFCISCQKESEILYSSWVIMEYCVKNTDILRIPSLGLICSVLKSDIFVALYSTYICFKKIKNFVKPSWVNQSIQ